jgi:hypothetical protein
VAVNKDKVPDVAEEAKVEADPVDKRGEEREEDQGADRKEVKEQEADNKHINHKLTPAKRMPPPQQQLIHMRGVKFNHGQPANGH